MNPFDSDFYATFSDSELKFIIYRNNQELSKKITGINTGTHIMVSPDNEMFLEVGDLLQDGHNQYVATEIKQPGGAGNIWQISVLTQDEYKRKHTSANSSVVNNITNSGNLGQAFGNNNDVSISAQNDASLQDLFAQIQQVKSEDRTQLMELIEVVESLNKEDTVVKKGFLQKFDNLIGKYPNLSDLTAKLIFAITLGHKI